MRFYVVPSGELNRTEQKSMMRSFASREAAHRFAAKKNAIEFEKSGGQIAHLKNKNSLDWLFFDEETLRRDIPDLAHGYDDEIADYLTELYNDLRSKRDEMRKLNDEETFEFARSVASELRAEMVGDVFGSAELDEDLQFLKDEFFWK